MKRELFTIKEFGGEFYDVSIKSNGRATNYVEIENVFEGGTERKAFRNRAKAIAFAEKKFEELN